jgi:predicted amidohydrolase
VVNNDGDTIANYRKKHLFDVDARWALEGKKGFFTGVIPYIGNTTIGICK